MEVVQSDSNWGSFMQRNLKSHRVAGVAVFCRCLAVLVICTIFFASMPAKAGGPEHLGELYLAIGLGVLGVVVGGVIVGVLMSDSEDDDPWNDNEIGSLVEESKLTVGPMVMPDVRGNAAFGIGLRLADW